MVSVPMVKHTGRVSKKTNTRQSTLIQNFEKKFRL